jgi:hypothetical protein
MLRFALMALLLVQAGGPLRSPPLRIEAPAEFNAVRSRLESIDPRRFSDIAQLVGITDPGGPIRVVLAGENSDLAHQVAPWVAGFAIGSSDLVVLFPARSPGYPDNTLEDVLRHEVAHVLIWRAASGRPVPRWFDEGLAMAAERERQFQDQTQLLYQLVTGSRTSLDQLNRLFAGGQREQARAYGLAGALVHDVIQRQGSTSCGEILMQVKGGIPFDAAFADVSGLTPAEWELAFWHRQRVWTAWASIITSSTTVWLAVTVLAILAIYRRRQRNRAIEERWAREEEEDEP